VAPEPAPSSPAPGVAPEPSPNGTAPEPAPVNPPSPAPNAPAPVNPPAPSAPAPSPVPPPPAFVFDQFNTTTTPGPRTGAVVGTNSDYSQFFVLGGSDTAFGSQFVLPYAVYSLNLASRVYTALNVNFTRTGACYSQDSSLSSIWIYGGVPDTVNNATLLTFNLNGNTFSPLAAPPAGISTELVSCVATNPAGSNAPQFYVLFGLANETCSNHVAFYNSSSNWTTVANPGAAPAIRSAANAVFYENGNSIVTFGGVCNGDYFNDVNRFNLTNNQWLATDVVAAGTPPSQRSSAVVFIQGDILFVFGGETQTGPANDAFQYNLLNKTWSEVTAAAFPSGRSGASAAALLNRAVFFGGSTVNTVLGETWQFVLEYPCQQYTTCEDCTKSTDNGCGWCGSCVAGDVNTAFVAGSCTAATTTYTNDIDSCPEKFPSYAIALIVIGGVVLVGIIIFAIMKWRSGKSGDYQEIS
jgi:hypothetical protein